MIIDHKKFRICPYNGEEFIPKRNNQIYASINNRIAFNNHKNNSKRNLLSPTNKILKKNHEILLGVLGGNKTVTVSIDYLKGMGFSFQAFTYVGTEDGIIYNIVYDIAYYNNKNQTIKIQKI